MSLGQSWIAISGLLGFLSVAFGAFGAHALKEKLEPSLLQIFHTGVQYQFLHSIVLLFIGFYLKAYPETSNTLSMAAKFFLAGILIFSGSLYILSLTGIKILGAITPIGGVFFLIGWSLMIKFGMKG